MTQKFLGELADVTQPTVGNWLGGTMPYPSHVNRLCAIFGVRREWLLYGEEPKFLPKKALRNVMREGDLEYGALAAKVTHIAQSGDAELIAQVDAFLDLVCRQLGVRRGKLTGKADQS